MTAPEDNLTIKQHVHSTTVKLLYHDHTASDRAPFLRVPWTTASVHSKAKATLSVSDSGALIYATTQQIFYLTSGGFTIQFLMFLLQSF